MSPTNQILTPRAPEAARPESAPTADELLDAERRRQLRAKRRLLEGLFDDPADPLRLEMLEAFARRIDQRPVSDESGLWGRLVARIDNAPVDLFFSLGQAPAIFRNAVAEVFHGE